MNNIITIRKPELLVDLEEKTSGMNIKELNKFLKDNINDLEQKISGSIRIGFHDLKNNHSDFYINGRKKGWSASTIKIPVMIATMQAIDNKQLSLDDRLLIDHKYMLEDTDNVSMMPYGELVSVHELLYHMIISSDNEATNMLADNIGLEYINDSMKKLGAKRTMIAHLLAYNVPRIRKYWNPGGDNLTTVKDMTRLLATIYNDEAASSANCDIMKSLLEQSHSKPLAVHLPRDTIVGNKIGIIYDLRFGDDHHDVGVINREYALSIMCNKVRPQTRNASASSDGFSAYEWLSDLFYEKDYFEEYDKYDKYPQYSNVSKNYLHPGQIISAVSKIVYDAYQNDRVSR